MAKKIFVIAGGTGGHVFPALCLMRELERRGKFNVNFASDSRGIRFFGGLVPLLVQNIRTSPRMCLYASLLISIVRSFAYLICNRPALIIGFGGYPSVPLVLAAQILGIKTVIHEQNAVVGKANKLLSVLATKIAVSFERTRGLKLSQKVVCIGNPTRFEGEYGNATKKGDTFTILIFGGSQGAATLSGDVSEAVCKAAKGRKIAVYHQCIKQDIDTVKNKYKSRKISAVVADFFDDIATLYMAADVVISRAGASSVFEIIGFKKPAILVPYQKSINGDQSANAQFLADNNAAIVVKEGQDFVRNMTNAIERLLDDKHARSNISNKLALLHTPDITKKFADFIDKLLAADMST